MRKLIYIFILSYMILMNGKIEAQTFQNKKSADSMLIQVSKMPNDTVKLQKLEELFFENRNTPFALIFSNEMIRVAKKTDNKYFYNSGLYKNELFYYTRQQIDSVYHYYNCIREKSMKDSSPELDEIFFNAWMIYIEVCVTQDNIELGKIESLRMLKEAEKRNSNKGKGFAYHELGKIESLDGNFDKAISYYKHSLNTKAFNKREEAVVYVLMAESSFISDDFVNAGEYYIKAIKNYHETFHKGIVPIEFYDSMVYNYIFVSYCYLQQNKMDKCEEWMKKADSLYKPDAMIGAYMYYHLFKAMYYSKKNDYANCMKHIALAEKRPENDVVVYTTLNYKIRALIEMKRFEEVLPLQRKCLSMQNERRKVIDKNNEAAIKQNAKFIEAQREHFSLIHKMSLVTVIATCLILSIVIAILFRVIMLQHLLAKGVKKLGHAEEEARKTDKMKELFLHNISHDVRVPLTSLLGFSQQLCSSDEMSSDERKMVRDILKKNSEKLLNLVNNVLDISRLESGKMKYTIAEFDLEETCRIAEFSLTNKEDCRCKLTLECHCDGPVMINHDQQRMLKTLCSTIILPSYVDLPEGTDEWNEKMILTTSADDDKKKTWTIIVENSPLCSKELESEEQSILNNINILYMKVIDATYETGTHDGKMSVILKGRY